MAVTLPNLQSGAVRALAEALISFGDADQPAKAMDAARVKTLHAVGVALAGRRLAVVDTAARAVSGRAGLCTAIGAGRRLDAEAAAFFNGVATHASLLEDCGPGGLREGSHPGTYVFPAALAAAEMAEASAGRFLRGMIVGYEAVSRIGMAAPSSIVARRFRPLGVMGPFGAAAAAAYILGSNADQMAAALAIAANSAGGSTQGVFEGSMEPFFQAGSAARNGLFAAGLGLAGAVVAKNALEGEFGFFETYGGERGDLACLLAERSDAGICSVGIKRFASCLQNQQTLALIVDGLDRPLQAEEIERVVITRPATGTNGLNSPGVSRAGPLPNRLAAQMSARFTAAGALLGKPVDDPNFYEAHHADARLLALTERIDLVDAADDNIRVEIRPSGGAPGIHLEGASPDLFHPRFETVRDRIVRRASDTQADTLHKIATIVESMDDDISIRALSDVLGKLA